MKKQLSTFVIILFLSIPVFKSTAQKFTDAVLFSIDGKDYYLSNYFDNHSKDNNNSYSIESAYFDLYLDFKIKVKEALDLNYHKKETFYSELNSYYQQLAKKQSGIELNKTIVEYFEGVLLYYITEDSVWTKANSNQKELFAYYKKNMKNYEGIYKNSEELQNSKEKPKIVVDLQVALEENWELALHKKHKITVNEGVRNNLQHYYKIYKQETQEIEFKNEYLDYLPYLSSISDDIKIDPRLVKAAYERMKWDVEAAHIFVKCDKNAEPSDTIAAYKKAKKIRSRIINGEDFHKLAAEMSDDPSTSKNGGNIGYFTAFQMVYPFELACYYQPIGSVPNPVRTSLGYHVIKVLDKRPNRGEVKVAHILVKDKAEIDKLLLKLKNGADFGQLAKEHSIDKGSSQKEGVLPWFGTGKMISEFADAAFNLENQGDYSAPVKTRAGWHIIKLIDKKPLQAFKEMEDNIINHLSTIDNVNAYIPQQTNKVICDLQQDNTPPSIKITSPNISRGFKPIGYDKQIAIKGVVTDKSGVYEVLINGQEAYIDAQGNFSMNVLLAIGDNTFIIKAKDLKGNTQVEEFSIERKSKGGAIVVDGKKNAEQEIQFGKFYALLIGVEEYTDPNINDLDQPVSDAQKFYKTLITHYTFDKENVSLLINPDKNKIAQSLDYYADKLTEKDNLLIFFAGHGYWDAKFNQGYWLASDADKSRRSTWLSNGIIRDYMQGISTKHSLLITDACFGGGIFKSRDAFSNNASTAINQLYKYPSRKAITSGALSEVPDKSVFIEYLIKRLEQNTEKYLSSEQLFSKFKIAVINNSENGQIPQFGEIKSTGDEGGDFIFIRKQ